jgi:hypothetical protein
VSSSNHCISVGKRLPWTIPYHVRDDGSMYLECDVHEKLLSGAVMLAQEEMSSYDDAGNNDVGSMALWQRRKVSIAPPRVSPGN